MQKKVTSIKKLWKGIFNYSHELFILYCYAYSKAQAREVFFRRLAAKHEVSIQTVRGVFDGGKDNFSIEEEK
jgi:hypothetical protein